MQSEHVPVTGTYVNRQWNIQTDDLPATVTQTKWNYVPPGICLGKKEMQRNLKLTAHAEFEKESQEEGRRGYRSGEHL